MLMATVTNVVAANYRDNAYDPVKWQKGTDTKAVTLMVVDNPQAVCNKESRKRGNKGFAYQVEACAFWTADACTVVISPTASMHTLGHEMRHCWQGDWHPQ